VSQYKELYHSIKNCITV